MEGKNRRSLYESAISVYHSAQCVFEIEEGLPNNDSDTVKAEYVENLEKKPILNDETQQKNNITDSDIKEKNNNEKYDKYLQITKLNLMIPWMSLILYLFDVVSDQILAVRYATEQKWAYAGLTTVFVLLPGFYVSIFVGKTWKEIISKGWKWYPLLVPLVFFNLEPAVLYMKNFVTVRKYLKSKANEDVKLQKKYYDKYLNGNRNVSDLKYVESLMEALPQFTLQGYIILKNYETLKLNDEFYLQMGSLTSSIVGLAVIIFVRHKIWLLASGIRATEIGRVVWTVGRFFSLVARTLCMTISASLYPGYTLIAIGIHWILAAAWRYVTHLQQLGFIEPIFQGAADTLVARVDSINNNIFSHFVMLIENIAMVTFWFCNVDDGYDSIKYILLPVVVSLNVVGSTADIVYRIFNNKFESKIENN